jgi:protein-S-isoprenylcysteine O-methyltransferase Ste14
MLLAKLIAACLLQFCLFAAMLLVPAGTWHWPQAWALLGLLAVATVATVSALYPSRQALLAERIKLPFQPGQPRADKIATFLIGVSFILQFVFIPLDVFHLHLLPRPSLAWAVLGLVLLGAGWWLVAVSFMVNPFAVPIVKYQPERRQRVIDGGPYRVIRHPIYAGAALFLIGMALWLRSTAAALVALLPIAMLVLRLMVEERFLRAQLPGYPEYCARVRYRFIPWLW